jgi:hypothetical protein
MGPAIIALAEFRAVQATLKARNPRTTPAREVVGSIPRADSTPCTTCTGQMTLRTVTSKPSQVHVYYMFDPWPAGQDRLRGSFHPDG